MLKQSCKTQTSRTTVGHFVSTCLCHCTDLNSEETSGNPLHCSDSAHVPQYLLYRKDARFFKALQPNHKFILAYFTNSLTLGWSIRSWGWFITFYSEDYGNIIIKQYFTCDLQTAFFNLPQFERQTFNFEWTDELIASQSEGKTRADCSFPKSIIVSNI